MLIEIVTSKLDSSSFTDHKGAGWEARSLMYQVPYPQHSPLLEAKRGWFLRDVALIYFSVWILSERPRVSR